MAATKYDCQLCFVADTTTTSMNTETFLKHLATTHDSIKMKNVLHSLELYGTDREKLVARLKIDADKLKDPIV